MTLSSLATVEEPVPSGEHREVSTVIARAQEGDGAAFAEIFQTYSRRVIGLYRHMLRDREQAPAGGTGDPASPLPGALRWRDTQVCRTVPGARSARAADAPASAMRLAHSAFPLFMGTILAPS